MVNPHDRHDPEQILARAQVAAVNGRPDPQGRDRARRAGIYIESWLPERRSRRKPLLFVHGELAGSWLWERYLGYFAARGWEGHALNLRNHYWSQTADPATLSFDTYTEDVVLANQVSVRLGLDLSVDEAIQRADPLPRQCHITPLGFNHRHFHRGLRTSRRSTYVFAASCQQPCAKGHYS